MQAACSFDGDDTTLKVSTWNERFWGKKHTHTNKSEKYSKIIKTKPNHIRFATFSSSSASDKHIIQSFSMDFTRNPPTFSRKTCAHIFTGSPKTMKSINFLALLNTNKHFPSGRQSFQSSHLQSLVVQLKFHFKLLHSLNDIIMLMVKAVCRNKIAVQCYFTWKVIFSHQAKLHFVNRTQSNRIRLRWLTAVVLLAKQTYLVEVLPFRTMERMKIWKSTFRENHQTEWTCTFYLRNENWAKIKCRYTTIRTKDSASN